MAILKAKHRLQLITEQSKGVQLVGAGVVLYNGSMIYQSVVNAFLLAATTYNTTLRDIIIKVFPWFGFWLFVAILVMGQLMAMWLYYKYLQPSIVSWNNAQVYKHNNLIRADIATLRREMLKYHNEISQEIEKLKKATPC